MNWWRQRKLRKAQEKYAQWKAVREAHERLGNSHCYINDYTYTRACSQMALYEERVEQLMREK